MTGPKNLSDKQLAANRRNAPLPTSPRTPEGKAPSRWNALKHGVLAQAVIPEPLQPYESRQQFDHLLATLRHDPMINSHSPLAHVAQQITVVTL